MAKVTYVLRVVRSTTAAETLSLSDGCDVSKILWDIISSSKMNEL